MADSIRKAAEELERLFGIKKSKRSMHKSMDMEECANCEHCPLGEKCDHFEAASEKSHNMKKSDEGEEGGCANCEHCPEMVCDMCKHFKADGVQKSLEDSEDVDSEDIDDEDFGKSHKKARKSHQMKKSHGSHGSKRDTGVEFEDDELPEEQEDGEEFEVSGTTIGKGRKTKKSRNNTAAQIKANQGAYAYAGNINQWSYGDEEDIPGQEAIEDEDEDEIVTNMGKRIKFKKKSQRANGATADEVYKSLSANKDFAEVVEASDALAHLTNVHAGAFDAIYREVKKSRRENAALHAENTDLRQQLKVIAKSLHALIEQQSEEPKPAFNLDNSLNSVPWGMPFPQQDVNVAKSRTAIPDSGVLQNIIEKSMATGALTQDEAATMMINISGEDGRIRVAGQLRERLGARVAKSFGL